MFELLLEICGPFVRSLSYTICLGLPFDFVSDKVYVAAFTTIDSRIYVSMVI